MNSPTEWRSMRKQWRSWSLKSPSWWTSCTSRWSIYLYDMVRESLTVLSLTKLYKPNLVSTPAHSNRPFLWGGPSSVPHWAQEGLCVRGLPDDPRKVHQHVRCAGWTEEHEVQCEERPLCLQTVHRASKSVSVNCTFSTRISDTRWQHQPHCLNSMLDQEVSHHHTPPRHGSITGKMKNICVWINRGHDRAPIVF